MNWKTIKTSRIHGIEINKETLFYLLLLFLSQLLDMKLVFDMSMLCFLYAIYHNNYHITMHSHETKNHFAKTIKTKIYSIHFPCSFKDCGAALTQTQEPGACTTVCA